MKTRIPLVASLLFLLLSFSMVEGQTVITPKTIRIGLTVGAPSPAVQSKVYNALVAELRKSRDLEIVDEGYVYGLEIVAYDIHTSTGLNFGYALSTITTNVIACQDMFQTKDGKLNIKYQVVNHALTLTDNSRLRSDAQSLVANFNKLIDPMRKVKVTVLN